MSNYLDNSIDDYNPFNEVRQTVPITSNPIQVPTFTPAIQPQSNIRSMNENTPILSEVKNREKIINPLVERADELNRREAELIKREQEFNKTQSTNVDFKGNNFPPFPKWCCFRPCFFQDFNVDIDEIYRPTVRLGYWIWLFYSFVLFFNVFGTLSYMIVSNVSTESGSTFGLALLLLLVLPPLSYILWFRPLYKSFRSQSSLNFFLFFIFLAVYLVLTLIQCLGINWLGSCGWINSSVTCKTNIGVGLFMMIISIGFTLVLLLSVFLAFKVNRLYRNTDASLAKAKSEFAQQSASAIFTA